MVVWFVVAGIMSRKDCQSFESQGYDIQKLVGENKGLQALIIITAFIAVFNIFIVKIIKIILDKFFKFESQESSNQI